MEDKYVYEEGTLRCVVKPNMPWIDALDTSIERGIAALNNHFGSTEWVNTIDLDRFELESGEFCVCGQLFASEAAVTEEVVNGYPIDEGYVFALHKFMDNWWLATGNGDQFEDLDTRERLEAYALNMGFLIDETSKGPWGRQWYRKIDGIWHPIEERDLWSHHYYTYILDKMWEQHATDWNFATNRWAERIRKMREEVNA